MAHNKPIFQLIEAMTLHGREKKLWWEQDIGCGYHPVDATCYDKEYFDKYVGYESTEVGRGINNFRVRLTKSYDVGTVLDIGIGSGSYLKLLQLSAIRCRGYDINPVGIKWLNKHNLFCDAYEVDEVDTMTFWDSLEHIKDFWKLLDRVKKYVFISIPIFSDKKHIESSKHFRPDEHCWYFTKQCLMDLMAELGFKLCELRDNETTKYGREDILTFVFKRVATS